MREEHPNVAVLARPDEGMRARARRIFDADQEVLPSLRPSFCGAHDRMYIFDPFGDIYACWERTGDPDVRIGRVTPDGDVEMKANQVAMWRSRTVASNPVCRRCRYALHCGGGCACWRSPRAANSIPIIVTVSPPASARASPKPTWRTSPGLRRPLSGSGSAISDQ